MISDVFLATCRTSPSVKKYLWKGMYQGLALYSRNMNVSFMNYGYEPVNEPPMNIDLDDVDKNDRVCIQLYHHVVSDVKIEGKTVLEVGSGRGGGSNYIKRYLKPKTIIGVDLSSKAVKLCNKNYAGDGLSYVCGDAENLKFEDESFDVVVNVESSHCYSAMALFLSEVKRVLKKGGYFLFADLRDHDKMNTLHQQLENTGMKLIKEKNITPNIVAALNIDSHRRLEGIKSFAFTKLFKEPFKEFAGVKGTKCYEWFRTEEVIYKSFVLQKP